MNNTLRSNLNAVLEVEKQIYNQLVEYNSYPFFYIVVNYSTRGRNELEKYNYKRLNYIHSTHKLIRRKLKEHFNVDIVNCFQERHKGYQEKWYEGELVSDRDIQNNFLDNDKVQYDEMINNGRYHSNIIMSDFNLDNVMDKPTSRIRKLLTYNAHSVGIPIENIFPYDDEYVLKCDLINACIRTINDVDKNYKRAVEVYELNSKKDVKYTLHYIMKECYNLGEDFNNIIDFNNSDILKEKL